MKLISLNTYCGYFWEPLSNFLLSHAADTDIFLLQEVLDSEDLPETAQGFRTHQFFELQRILSNFHGDFRVVQKNRIPAGREAGVNFGKATFIKNNISLISTEEIFIHGARDSFREGDEETMPNSMVATTIAHGSLSLTVCNVHGTYLPKDKRDSPERLAQSQRLIDFVSQINGEKIIAGDFNLFPDTESIAMIESAGYKNLIRAFSISTTRGSLVRQLHPEYGASPDGWQEFADYVFVSSGIRVKSFEVPDVPISDHLPMILEFDG